MTNIKLSYFLLIAVITGLWLAADPILSVPYEFFALRASLVNFTGIIAIGMMSVGIMLALRPVGIEPFVGGLDKTYRLHQWLGVTGFTFGVVHWLLAKGPKWMVGWGWLERPVRKPAAEQSAAIFHFLQSQRGLAESIGEWAFYALVVLLLLALWRRFPYRYFFKTHRVLAILYLLLVVHSVVLMKFTYWGETIAPLLAILMAGGTVAAFISLFRRVGAHRRAVAVIEEIVHHSDNRVLKVSLKLTDRWPGHEAGQFAFVTFDQHEGPHPFTISSAWHDDGKLFFLIKGIGDYTRTLPNTLKVGDLVKVEGPYGCFDFSGSKPRQIWVAGGIGITPFIARMEALAHRSDGKSIDLFYSTSAPDEGFIAKVRALAQAAQVQLHLLVTAKDGRLDVEHICRTVPQWPSADVWFCGPVAFNRAIHRDFGVKGLAASDFHQELFDLR